MNLLSVILPLAIQGTYTYSVPDGMPVPAPGTRVLVPLAKKEVVGIALGPADEHDSIDPAKIRDILEVLDREPIVTTTQLLLWTWMADYYMCPLGDVMAAALPAKALDRQYILDETGKKRRVKLPEYNGPIEQANILNPIQTQALSEIYEAFSAHDVCLLHGVTSSGKTEVYIHLILEQLRQGRQALFLVPEIALTTQLTNRLQRVFGNQLLVYHSRITDTQRMEIWRQLLVTDPAEKPRIIISARSGVFLPLRNLGLIIVDEEHETSYKQQDPAPRYHARSVAIMLTHLHKPSTINPQPSSLNHQPSPTRVLLGSATPSVETYFNATNGKYGLARMTERYAGLSLPRVTMIDLSRQYHRKEMYGHFSDPLVARMREELTKGKQIILFQNRRGYAPYIECTACGKTPHCTDCDVSMTVHMRTRLLSCHYCGASMPLPARCPDCGGEMRVRGFGTERLEEEITNLFPQARVLRLDLDTTRKKDDYASIISAFSRHECDILIGTQMVTKGLDFRDVSLVAVLNADSLMNIPDFRSYERTFQMLEQVAGRAGRAGEQGEVIIQSFDPSHPIYTYLSAHDYLGLYHNQLTDRQEFKYPPFHRLLNLTIRHTNEQKTIAAANALQARLQVAFGPRCSIVIEPGVARVQNRFIRQIRLKIESHANFARARQIASTQIHEILTQKEFSSVQILADVDPL